MKPCFLLFFLPVLAFAQTAPPAPVYPIPEPRQLAWQELQYYSTSRRLVCCGLLPPERLYDSRLLDAHRPGWSVAQLICGMQLLKFGHDNKLLGNTEVGHRIHVN